MTRPLPTKSLPIYVRILLHCYVAGVAGQPDMLREPHFRRLTGQEPNNKQLFSLLDHFLFSLHPTTLA